MLALSHETTTMDMHTHVKPACGVEEEEDIYSRPVQRPFFSLIPDKEGSTKFIESIVWPTTTSTPLNTTMEFSTQTQTPQVTIQLDYSSICQAPSPAPSPTAPYYFAKKVPVSNQPNIQHLMFSELKMPRKPNLVPTLFSALPPVRWEKTLVWAGHVLA